MAVALASGTYKIVSCVDGNVFDAANGGGKKGCKLITWPYGSAANQHFNINVEGSGFRLANAVAAKKNDAMLMVDYTDKDGLCVMDFNGTPSQQWEAIVVDGGVLLRQVETGKCIRSMGCGNQVELFDEAPEDKSQHWNLIMV